MHRRTVRNGRLAGRVCLAVLILGFGRRAWAGVADGSVADPEASTQRRLAVGINDMGGQVRLHFNPHWAAELRFQTGTASSDAGTVGSLTAGMRIYRFSQEHRRCRFYGGFEGDYAQTTLRSVNSNIALGSGFGNTSGYAAGGFGGMEYRIVKRLYLDLDMGPYFISLKEKLTGVSETTPDVVVNAALCFYAF